MKNFLFLLSLLILLALPVWSQPQPPDTAWTKTYGGNSADNGKWVQQTTDGGFVIVGSTSSLGANNPGVYLIKTDFNGDQQWCNTFGGTTYYHGNCVHQTMEGGYFITGYCSAGSSNFYLVKTTSLGIEQWHRVYGGTEYDMGCEGFQTLDGGYIVVGYTYSFGAGGYDVYLIKTDSLGLQQWSSTFGGTSSDYGNSIQQTIDGGYIIVGETSSFGAGAYDVYLIKTDSLGNQQWYRTYGGNSVDNGCSVQQTSDGGFIITGFTSSFGAGSYDIYLIKTDEFGNQQWYRVFGGISTEYGYSVHQTLDGGYIIAGYTISFGAGGHDVYIIKTDIVGNQLWSRTIGGNLNDEAQCIQQASDGSYIIVGKTTSYGTGGWDVYLIRLEGIPFPVTITLTPDIQPIVIPAVGGTFGYTAEIINSGITTRSFNGWMNILKPDGNTQTVLNSQVFTLTAGETLTHHLTQSVPARAPAGTYRNRGFLGANIYNVLSADSFQFTKSAVFDGKGFPIEDWALSGWDETYDATNDMGDSFITHHSSFIISAIPNPFNSSVALRFEMRDASEIELKIFDISGREVAALGNGHWALGEHSVVWNAEGMPSGIYFAKLSVVGGQSVVKKVVLMK
jgi:hypothetical protein